MRRGFHLIPVAIVVAASPAHAKIYMDVKRAQQIMFPGTTLVEHQITLDQTQYNAIIDDSDVAVYTRTVKAWRTPAGDWFVLDRARGRDDWITYAVGIDSTGILRHIEILECLDNYDQIRAPNWRAQFRGKKRGSKFEDVPILSGATLSSEQIIAGVRRTLSTVALALQPSIEHY